MKPLFIGIGLCLIAAGSFLSFVGHYDGVLGADDPERLMAQHQTRHATARITVLGTPQEAQDEFRNYQDDVLALAVRTPLQQHQWVRVQLSDTDAEAYLRVDDQPPAIGSLLVFTGDIHAYWPVFDADTPIGLSKPILLLEAADYHAPLLFKE